MCQEGSGSICEEKNYQRIYSDNSTRIRNFLYYKCGNLEKAEDLMHEAFIKLWENCLKVLSEKAPNFLYTVANRLFINDINHQRVVLSFEKSQKPERTSENPEFIMEEMEFKFRLEHAIAGLSEGQRQVFLMNRIDKLSYKEIAETLEISVKAVEKRMHNALLNLKSAVSELEMHKI